MLGNSLADYNIISPQTLVNSFDEHECKVNSHLTLFLDQDKENGQERIKRYDEIQLIRSRHQIFHDLQLLTPLGRCFILAKEEPMFKTCAKMLLQDIFKRKKNIYNQMLLMKNLHFILKSDSKVEVVGVSDLDVYAEFFQDLP